MSFIKGLSNGFISEGCPMGFSIGGSSNGFQKQKYFVLKTISYMANACVRESVRTDELKSHLFLVHFSVLFSVKIE